MERKTYSLRSRQQAEQQTRLEFPCRRSGRARVKRPLSGKAADENEASPPKRGRLSAKAAACKVAPPHPTPPTLTPTKSPLKETNQMCQPGHVTLPRTPPDCCVATPDISPVIKTLTTPRARKRLQFSPSLTPLQKTKRSLHGSLPSTLPCRDTQQQVVREFVEERVRGRRGGSLYISGAPGTGKTACVQHLMREMKSTLSKVKVLTINCMSVTSPQALYGRLATELLGGKGGRGKEALKEKIISHLTTSKNMILLVLDELDQLDCRNQEVLYSLFEWSSLPKSRLILIGIANSLDLTDRILPRLTTHTHCKPHLLHFPPYSREEIATILSERVRGEGGSGDGGKEVVMERAAVEFCARKVSAVHGDLRKALDICRRAIELAEGQTVTPVHTPRTSTPSHPPKSSLTPPPSHPHNVTPLCVKLSHVAKVISEVYSNPTITPSTSTHHSLPLQQKLIIATLLLLVKGKNVKEVMLGRLQDAYSRVCCHWQLKQEGETEFVGLCHVLEARGLLGLRRGKETRLTKVTLKLQETEVESALQDQPLLSSVLQQDINS